MKLIQKICLLILIGMNLTSCATIINGTTQKVPLSSEPAGAAVSVNGQPMGFTPTQVELKRKHSHLIAFDKEGFEPQTVKLDPVLSGAVAGNILAGGVIGWGVDAVNGAQYRLIPDAVNVKMRPYGYQCHTFNPPYYSQ